MSEIAKALIKFHAELPKVGKGSTNPAFKSKYADLGDIVAVVLPALAAQGLAWIARPKVTTDGFVLKYELRHVSGERVKGTWPLPDPERAKAQELGSAVTYAKRYALSAVTGIAPDEDDDGNAASKGPGSAPRRRPAVNSQDRIAGATKAIAEAATIAELDAVWVKVRQYGLDGVAPLPALYDGRAKDLAGTEGALVDHWAPATPEGE